MTNVSIDAIKELDKDLKFYEKVSLVFLLLDDCELALEKLKACEKFDQQAASAHSLISAWVELQLEDLHWQDKIVEALCIIQCFSVIEKWGFKKDDQISRFLPFNKYVSIYVSLERKKLYMLCESLNKSQTAALVNISRRNDDVKSSNFASDHLEMHILQWFSCGYIAAQDMANLAANLKEMGLLDESELIKGINCKSGERSDSCVESRLNHAKSNINSNDCYPIDQKNVGICLIINQKNFYIEKNPKYRLLLPLDNRRLEDRQGTDVDKKRLESTFKRFGFKVFCKENLTHQQILDAIKKTTEKEFEKRQSCLVVCILSHGIKDAVFGVNSIPVDLSDIQTVMYGKYCPALLGKPKILVVQACQGDSCQNVVRIEQNITLDGNLSTPEKSDLLVFHSTIPGYASVRNKSTGSWFIQCLCDCLLNESKNKHFADILPSVIRAVTNMRWNAKDGTKCMVPQYYSTFTKHLYLKEIVK